MKFPKPAFRGGSRSLPELLETNRREDEARRRRRDDFDLREFLLNLRSRDRLSKYRARRALPARDDQELVDMIIRLLQEASSNYLQLRMQWQREAVGYLTSLAAEALCRIGEGPLEVPDDLDYVGLLAEGAPERRLGITARYIGDFAGLKARYLDVTAGSVGDYCLRRAFSCSVSVDKAGKCLGEEGEALRLQAREAGDWLMLKSRSCHVKARRVGRLAGLDSHNLELHVDHAGAELGARAKDAVIYVYHEAKSLGLRGSGTIYMRDGTPPWRTSFHVEKMES
jgi:hypothetical protein